MQKRSLIAAIILVVSLVTSGCATHPDKLPKTYVSPMAFTGYTCDQTQAELRRITDRINRLYADLAEKAQGDASQMAAAWFMSALMLFALEGGDGPEAYEYARLMGEHESLLETAANKECAFYKAGKIPRLWFAGEAGLIVFEVPHGRSYAESKKIGREFFSIRLDWIAGPDEKKLTNEKRKHLRVPVGKYAVSVSPYMDAWALDEPKTFVIEIEPDKTYHLSGRRLDGADWEPVLWAISGK